jgi:sec-independent protein translocase protein TatA
MALLNIGAQEIILIVLAILLLFGGKKIPELMRGLGKGVKEYKNAVNSVEDEIKSATSSDEAKKDDKA